MVNTWLFEGKADTAEMMIARYDSVLTGNDSLLFKNYKDYALGYNAWMATDTSIMRLDSVNLVELRVIAGSNEHKRGSNMARNVLNFFYDSAYFTPAVLPDMEFAKRETDITKSTASPGITQPILPPSLRLYPNPAQNVLNVEFNNLAPGSRLVVVNMQGIIVEDMALPLEEGKIQLNTSGYTNGIYLLHIESGGKRALKNKFIILK